MSQTMQELIAKAGVLERETSFLSSFPCERNIDARVANSLSLNYFLPFFFKARLAKSVLLSFEIIV